MGLTGLRLTGLGLTGLEYLILILTICTIISIKIKSTIPVYIGFLLFLIIYFKMNKGFGDNNKPKENFQDIPYAYGTNGELEFGYPQYYNVPQGSVFFYGQQESLLNKPDHSTWVNPQNNNQNYLPSQYHYPKLTYGVGPEAYRLSDEILTSRASLDNYPQLRAPTKNNPFMNVMPMDYDGPQVFNGYEKIIYQNPNGNRTRNEMEEEFERGLYQNPSGSLWKRINSQRQFISQPVESVPSSQTEFANWLYGNEYVCKSGSIWDRYGVKYTDDSLVCNGFNVASPTNAGLLRGNFMTSME